MGVVLRVPHAEGCAVFLEALDAFLDAVEPLDDHALLGSTWCWGWTVVDVVTHVRLGLDEVAACLLAAGTADAAPDHDAATYWLTMPPGGGADAVGGVLAVRRVAAATRVPTGALPPLQGVAAGLRAAVPRLVDGVVVFQGHVLTTGDLLATWAVELAVHQLDLAREVAVPVPPLSALGVARRTVDALAGARLDVPAFAGRLPAR